MDIEHQEINQKAFINEISLLGIEGFKKLIQLRVLLYGISGLGAQVSKNLILMNIKKLTLFDNTLLSRRDLRRNIYTQSSLVGKLSRAQASRRKLQELNPQVVVDIISDIDQKNISQNYDCVIVLDNYDREQLIHLNEMCRKNNIGFIYGGVLGLYGFAFVDFGTNWCVTDQFGEKQDQYFVSRIYNDQNGTVFVSEIQTLKLMVGDLVYFQQVQGMENKHSPRLSQTDLLTRQLYYQQTSNSINNVKFKIISVNKNLNSFCLGDLSLYSEYKKGGIVRKAKQSRIMNFVNIQESLQHIKWQEQKAVTSSWDLFNIQSSFKLHFALNSVLEFYKKLRRIPSIGNNKDADQLVQFYCSWYGKYANNDIKQKGFDSNDVVLVKNIAMFAQTQIAPICNIWGGIISNQVVKLTQKFTPLFQWFHHQFFNIIPTQQQGQQIMINQLENNDYTIIFGSNFQERLSQTNVLLVGAGSKGNQIAKILALMGISTKKGSKIICFDNKKVSSCNQYSSCFSQSKLGQNKSKLLCSKFKQIKQQSNFIFFEQQLEAKNLDKLQQSIFQEVDLIIGAVNKQKSKMFINNECIFNQKAFILSGNHGGNCSVQVFIPHKTAVYESTSNDSDCFSRIDLSTIKNFPYKIQHTIKYAQDYLNGFLVDPIQQIHRALNNPKQFADEVLKQHKNNNYKIIQIFQNVKLFYQIVANKSYKKCIQYAMQKYCLVFCDNIVQFLKHFPQNHINEYNQKLFWQERVCKCPRPLPFNQNQKFALQFIRATVKIMCEALNIQQNDNFIGYVRDYKPQVKVKKLTSQYYNPDKKLQKEIQFSQNEQINQLYSQILNYQKQGQKINLLDIDHNEIQDKYVDFVYYFSCLRARNYSIKQIQRLQTKLIFCKIKPKIITSSSIGAGFTAIQAIKLLLNKPLQIHKSSYYNLSAPLVVLSQLMSPKQTIDQLFDPIYCGPVKAIPKSFTSWDKIHIRGPMSVYQLKQLIEVQFNVQIFMISTGPHLIYSNFGTNGKQHLYYDVKQAIQIKQKNDIFENKKAITICVCGQIGDQQDCMMPDIKYYF